LPAPPRPYNAPALSPDGQRVAVVIRSNTMQIWIYDLPRGTLTQFTSEGRSLPIWTPDGKRLTYHLLKAGSYNIFWRTADGAGPEERLTTGENLQDPSSWSPKGLGLYRR